MSGLYTEMNLVNGVSMMTNTDREFQKEE